MAHVIGIPALARLLAEAEETGARFAWIAENRLMMGAELGCAVIMADLGAEALITSSSANKKRKPSSMPPGTARRDPQDGTEGREWAPEAMSASFSMPASVDVPTFSGRQTGMYNLVLEGRIFAARSQKELLLIGLSAIERTAPGTMAKLEQEMSRTKRVVSKRRETLNKDPRLAEKFSQRIEGEWWVFTNNSFPETEKFLRRAGFHAGLHVDVRKLA